MKKLNLSNCHPASNDNQDSSLSIFNENSKYGSFYHMKVPFQISLEYCSGTSSNDYYNFLIASHSGVYSFSSPYTECSYYYANRPLHRHDFYELMIILKGKVIQTIEETDYTYPAGTCCFINRNLLHRENFIDETQLLFLNFSADFMRELLFSVTGSTITPAEYLPSTNPFYNFINTDLHVESQKAYLDFFPGLHNNVCIQYLHTITDSILHEMLFPKLGTSFRIKGLICNLILYLSDIEHYHVTSVNLNSKPDFLLFCRINHLMEDSYGRITRRDLENKLNYTGDYLNRIIKKYSGLCLFDYGMTFCLKEAKYLLLHSDKTISSISENLGFTNRTHFYKLFKAKYGLTPNEYRKKHTTNT